MNKFTNGLKKHPVLWTIFTFYFVGWLVPLLIEVFFTPIPQHDSTKGHHSPFGGFLILSIFYLLFTLTLGFTGKNNNIYLKLSGYIGFSLIIFIAIYNG
ncbi:hypothetical protein [Pedobacter zeae]|uniref:Uncharacterized protein n=1 Tax=Pedobacter zeae TaxID=1737356 RepID=A0A7W6KAB6_9SPHI|nr:hypothetical protein [Pedobacter zeae]MBB4108103.1 hypothetical protein [Pedobacter zeae]GGG95021.1 hypothetical protein GCM10007422_05610 [Pedobacter zeae]